MCLIYFLNSIPSIDRACDVFDSVSTEGFAQSQNIISLNMTMVTINYYHFNICLIFYLYM